MLCTGIGKVNREAAIDRRDRRGESERRAGRLPRPITPSTKVSGSDDMLSIFFRRQNQNIYIFTTFCYLIQFLICFLVARLLAIISDVFMQIGHVSKVCDLLHAYLLSNVESKGKHQPSLVGSIRGHPDQVIDSLQTDPEALLQDQAGEKTARAPMALRTSLRRHLKIITMI